MDKTHVQHLKDHGYTPTAKDPYSGKAADHAYQMLVTAHGEGNVWDYRILDEVFDVSNTSFTFGIMFDAVKRDTGERGSLSQTDFGQKFGIPRFYYHWSVSNEPV